MERHRSLHIIVFSEILPGGASRPNDPAQTATTAAQVTHGEDANDLNHREERI